MAVIAFTIPGAAVGKGRPRIGKVGPHARMFTPEKTMSYERLVAYTAHIAMGGRPLLDTAVAVNLFIDCAVPASWSGKKQRAALAGELLPSTRPDIDNCAKVIFDGLNGVLWRDDVLVVDCRVRKRYAPTPCVRIEVWELEPDLRPLQAQQPDLVELDAACHLVDVTE